MEKLAEKISKAICKNNPGFTVEQGATIKFGLECALNEASKIAVYLIIFALFSLTAYYLVAVTIFCVSRIFAGGYHAETYLRCFFVTLVILSIGIFTGSLYGIPIIARTFLLLTSIILAWAFAPVDHPNKPIISSERRKRFKYLSVTVFTMLACITFLFKDGLATTAVITLFLEALSLPLGQLAKRRMPA